MPAPYRADHVGSLLRPPELLEAWEGAPDPERLRSVEDRHIRRVLTRQAETPYSTTSAMAVRIPRGSPLAS